MNKRNNQIKSLFILFMATTFFGCGVGSSGSGDGPQDSISSSSSSGDNRGVASSKGSNDEIVIDLSGGKNEAASIEEIKEQFEKNNGEEFKKQLVIAYHRIKYLIATDTKSRGIFNSFSKSESDYDGLDLIIKDLFDPTKDVLHEYKDKTVQKNGLPIPENFKVPEDYEGVTIFEKIQKLKFVTKYNRFGETCEGEYHMKPDSPMKGRPDWRDMSVQLLTNFKDNSNIVCVNLWKFAQLPKTELKKSILAVLAMETAHLMGYDRKEAELLRNWFVAHPHIAFSSNDSFVSLFETLGKIDRLLFLYANQAIAADGIFIEFCKIANEIIDLQKDLQASVISKTDPLNTIPEGRFYKSVYIPVPSGDTIKNNGGFNFPINQQIQDGTSDIGFPQAIVYDVFNKNNIEDFITSPDTRGCGSGVEPFKPFSLADRKNILVNYNILVKYYQHIYNQLISYQYSDLQFRGLDNPLSLKQARMSLRAEFAESPELKYEFKELDLIAPLYQEGVELPKLSCDVSFQNQNIHEKSEEPSETKEFNISYDAITFYDPNMMNKYIADSEPYYNYFEEPEINHSYRETPKFNSDQPYGPLSVYVQYDRYINGHVIGVVPTSFKYKVSYDQDNMETLGPVRTYTYQYLLFKEWYQEVFEIKKFNVSTQNMEKFAKILYKGVNMVDVDSWDDFPLDRVDGETKFHIDNKGILVYLHPERNPVTKFDTEIIGPEGKKTKLTLDCGYIKEDS